MLSTSPSRIINYVPEARRAAGFSTPVFQIRTPSGKQRAKFFDAFRGFMRADDAVDVEMGDLVTRVVETCLVGWRDFEYDDPADPDTCGRPIKFVRDEKLDPLSPALILELFKFIQGGCVLAKDDLLPLGSARPSSSDNSAPRTVSNVRTTPNDDASVDATVTRENPRT